MSNVCRDQILLLIFLRRPLLFFCTLFRSFRVDIVRVIINYPFYSIFMPRRTFTKLSYHIKVTIFTLPTEWYHVVFNYIRTNDAEGVTLFLF